MADPIELPVAEIESEVESITKNGNKTVEVTLRVRFKGQRPEDKCLLKLSAHPDFIKAVHDAKKRGGTVWVRFEVTNDKDLTKAKLVVRDLLE